MSEELEKMIIELHNKIDEAQYLKRKIENYLSWECDVDVFANAGFLEDENIWVYGYDYDAVEECIKEAKENK